MIYLILAVISSALVSITMRLSGKYTKNNISMLAVSYAFCIPLAGMYLHMGKGIFTAPGMPVAVLLGSIAGFLYLAGFILLQWNVATNGVVLSATFAKLGVLVPTILSLFLFGERLRLMQGIGVVTALAAILLINFDHGHESARSKSGLVVLLIGGGLADSMVKFYEEYGTPKFEEFYLWFTFASAFLFSVILVLYKKQRLHRNDVIWGILLGIPNYFSARFLLKALGRIPAVITYPTYCVSMIVVVSLVGVIIFKEKLNKRQVTGIGIILLALVMLNI